MKKIYSYILSLLIILLLKAIANPIAIFYISEFFPTSDDNFYMEIYTTDIDNLDGWYISSKTDIAYLKDGLSTNGELLLITQDSLKSHLSFNPLSDKIILCSPDGPVDGISYGDVEDSYISSPKFGQSICLHVYYDESQHYYYYLDSTPSLGFYNDTSGAMGYMDGYVVDSLGNPISGLEIIYDSEFIPPASVIYHTVTTDGNGYFIFTNISRRISLYLKNDIGYGSYLLTGQIYPNDTTTVHIVSNVTSIHKYKDKPKLSGLYLEQNYPNPFNSSTTFYYSLDRKEYIDISIYDLRGRLVDLLYSGFKNPGRYNIVWDAGNISSGVYIIQLSSLNLSLTRKCLYLK